MTLTPDEMKSKSFELLQDILETLLLLTKAIERHKNGVSFAELSKKERWSSDAVYIGVCYSGDAVHAVALLIANDLAEQGFAIIRPVSELAARLAWSGVSPDGWSRFRSRIKRSSEKTLKAIGNNAKYVNNVQNLLARMSKEPDSSLPVMPDSLFEVLSELCSTSPETPRKDRSSIPYILYEFMNFYVHADLNMIGSPVDADAPLDLAFLLAHNLIFLLKATEALMSKDDLSHIRESVSCVWEKIKRLETERQASQEP